MIHWGLVVSIADENGTPSATTKFVVSTCLLGLYVDSYQNLERGRLASFGIRKISLVMS